MLSGDKDTVMVGLSGRGVAERVSLVPEDLESNEAAREFEGGDKVSKVSPSLYTAREPGDGVLRDFAGEKCAANFKPIEEDMLAG